MATENSRAAFQQAIAEGADYLELDVRVTRDEHLFLMHDRKVDRTTNGTGRIARMTRPQVRALRLNDGQRVPSLGSILSLAASDDVDVLIEMKAMGDRSTYVDLARQVRDLGVNRVRVSAFSAAMLDRLRTIAPDIRQAWIVGKTSAAPSAAEVAPYDSVAVHYSLLTDEWLAAMPYPVYGFTMDTPDLWAQWGPRLAGVITNQSAAFAQFQPACTAASP